MQFEALVRNNEWTAFNARLSIFKMQWTALIARFSIFKMQWTEFNAGLSILSKDAKNSIQCKTKHSNRSNNYQHCWPNKFGSCCVRLHASLETQGQSVGSGKKAGRKFSSKGGRAPGYRLSPNYFQKFKRMPAPDWAQKMLCIIVPNRRTVSPEFFSGVRTRRLLSWHTCPVRSPSLCAQGKL